MSPERLWSQVSHDVFGEAVQDSGKKLSDAEPESVPVGVLGAEPVGRVATLGQPPLQLATENAGNCGHRTSLTLALTPTTPPHPPLHTRKAPTDHNGRHFAAFRAQSAVDNGEQ